jgi:histidinol-phosphate aminotransferase
MPRFRADLDRIAPYVPGRGEQEILREYGLDHVVKLASNESPLPPFPPVIEVMRAFVAGVNRYPETTYVEVAGAVAEHLGVAPENLWFGGGGASLLLDTALAAGGPGTSAVYAHPSFVVYRLATAVSGADAVEVPLDGEHRHELDAMAAAVRDDTTVVYVCNPNNPTGTYVATAAVRDLVDALPPSVLVVVDEAYAEYVDEPDYHSMVLDAVAAPNLVVLRTFSKIYGLAGLRIGYLVGRPDVLASLRRTQLPFTVTGVAQAAAVEALRHPDEVARRLALNAAARSDLVAGLRARGFEVADSVTNFVFTRPGMEATTFVEGMLHRGVIVRPTNSPWVRISVGTTEEVAACFTAIDSLIEDRSWPARS